MMSDIGNVPYVLQLKDGVKAIHLTESTGDAIYFSNDGEIQDSVCIQPFLEAVNDKSDIEMEIQNGTSHVNYVYEMVYPDQLDLKPIYNLKRGRPKKKKNESIESRKVSKPSTPTPVQAPVSAPRTRSGRIVRFPKHIEKDFKKVEIEDNANDREEVRTSEFIRFEEPVEEKIPEKSLEFHQRKRKIASQYKCPKCKKAYLGKSKMIQHIKKYPDHGPLPISQNDINFDVWNYLVDITQKCPPAQRGIKFCEELKNLLNNVLILTSALFKKVEFNKNQVEVDKVLGNAIGLSPGLYRFNDSELYKDVTVLKFIKNAQLFKPLELIDSESEGRNNLDTHSFLNDNEIKVTTHCEKQSTESEQYLNKEAPRNTILHENYSSFNDYSIVSEKNDNGNKRDNLISKTLPNSLNNDSTIVSTSDLLIQNNPHPVSHLLAPNRQTSNINDPSKRNVDVHNELLSENSLLHLPNLRNTVDDLILPTVDSNSSILENSISSDEVMNVDQFVNERFKKITEPDMELGSGCLNIDLPALDLFQFHTG